jgi:hypothetical protein
LVFERFFAFSRQEPAGRIFPIALIPHPSSCRRRLRKWEAKGVFQHMWRAFLSELDHRGIRDWDEVFVDATFFTARKVRGVGKTKLGKQPKSMVLVDGRGIPLGSYTELCLAG